MKKKCLLFATQFYISWPKFKPNGRSLVIDLKTFWIETYDRTVHFGLLRELKLILQFHQFLDQFPRVFADGDYRPRVYNSIRWQRGRELDFWGRLGLCRLSGLPWVWVALGVESGLFLGAALANVLSISLFSLPPGISCFTLLFW